jgi:hypothetical protein
MADRDLDRRRRSFGPTVLVGFGGAAIAAIAGTKHWVSTSTPQTVLDAQGTAVDAPGVTALALVALAAWGVVLVTRGRFRRVMLVIAALAAVAALPVGWAIHQDLPTGTTTAWPWLAVAGLLLSAAAAAGGVRLARGWPEMGRKYDAPTGAAKPAVPLEEQSSVELWKSIGEGHDPTVDRTE